jgi:hypothetical protein
MPDYENDIVFKPELTWKELCEYAKSKGAFIWEKTIHLDNLCFSADGNIETADYDIVAEHRTYEQMKTIIQALYEE